MPCYIIEEPGKFRISVNVTIKESSVMIGEMDVDTSKNHRLKLKQAIEIVLSSMQYRYPQYSIELDPQFETAITYEIPLNQ